MCVEKTGGMGADAHAKLTSSLQAVGLLAVLADSDKVMCHTFGKQELWRHILDAHTDSNFLVQEITCKLSEKTMDTKPQAPAIPSSRESKARVKKVRFAPDVVEPAGDSRVYRGKNEVNMMAKKKASAVKKGHTEGWHHRKVSVNVEVLKGSSGNSGCKAQTLAKPYLPANRMLLYKGKQPCRVYVS